MANTYEGQPFAGTAPYSGQTAIDTVRFLIGDTDATDWQLQDGEISGLFSNNANDEYQAAIAACVAIAAKYARQVNKAVGNASVEAEKRMEHYTSLRKELALQSMRHGGAPQPYVGGISQADQEVDQEDDDLVQPDFAIGMTDNPDTGIDLISGSGFSQVVPG